MAIGTPYSAATTVDSTATSASDAITTTADVPLGDTLFLEVTTRINGGSSITSVTNSGSLAVTPDIIAGSNAANGQVYIVRIYASVDIPSGTTFTINYSNSPTRHEINAYGVSGVADATPDANHQGTADLANGVTSSVSTAGTTPASGDLAIGVWNHYGNGANGETGTPSSGFTELVDHQVASATPYLHQYVEYEILGAGGTVTSAPSFGSETGGKIGLIVVFQPAAGGGTTYNVSASASVATVAVDIRLTTLGTISDSVATTAGVQRSTTLGTISDSVATAAAAVRSTTLNAISDSVATVAGVVRQGLLTLSDAVATVADDVVDFIAAGGTTYMVSASASVAATAAVVRQGLLNVRASISFGDGVIITLGVSDQALGGVDLEAVEESMGRPFVGLRQNADTPATWASTSAHTNKYTNNGWHRSYRSLQIKTTGGWADVAAGVYDTELTDFANAIMAAPTKFNPTNPFIVCFGHETSTDLGTAGTAQEFIDAFRYVRDFFDGLGATVYDKTGVYLGGPLQMAYIGWDRMFTNGSVNSPAAGESYTDLDPDQGSSPAPAGTSYYEYCGSDVYNQVDAPGVLRYGTDAATLLDDVVAQATSRGKQFIFGEFGISDGSTATDHTNKADWLASAQAYLEALPHSGPGSCAGIWITIKSSVDNYNVDSSPESQAAYSDFINSPMFGTPVRVGASVVRQAQLSLTDSVATVTGIVRQAALHVTDSVATAASVTRATTLGAIRATVGTVGRVVRQTGLAIGDAVATVAQAVLLRAIPASPNPESSNQITITQEPNQISVQQTVNVVSVTTEPNQTRITNNGVNIVTVEEA